MRSVEGGRSVGETSGRINFEETVCLYRTCKNRYKTCSRVVEVSVSRAVAVIRFGKERFASGRRGDV